MLNLLRSDPLRGASRRFCALATKPSLKPPSTASNSALLPPSCYTRRRALHSSSYMRFPDEMPPREGASPPLPGRTVKARPMPAPEPVEFYERPRRADWQQNDRQSSERDELVRNMPERTPFRPKRGDRSVHREYDRAHRELAREAESGPEARQRSKYRNDRPADARKKSYLEEKQRRVEESIPVRSREASELSPVEPPNFTLSIKSVRPADAPPLASFTNKLERRMTRLKPVTEKARKEEQQTEILQRATKVASESQLDAMTHCWGCGVEFQTKEPHKLGYVATKAFERYKLKRQLFELKLSASSTAPLIPLSSANAMTTTAALDFVPTPEMLELERKILGLDAEPSQHVSTSPAASSSNPPTRDPHHQVIEELTTAPERVMCERCWALRYNSKVVPVAVDAEYFKQAVAPIKELKTRPLILKLVDLFDFHGSFIPGFRRYIGNNPVLIVATKFDLLPKGVHFERVRDWIHIECKKFGIEPVGVSIISHRGFGVRELADKLEHYREGGDVYVMGSANVGKSTFINLMIDTFKGPKDKKVTVSAVPGTTLNFLSLPIGVSSFLYDTPGIITSKQIYNYLSIEELKRTMPKKQVRPSVYRISPGTTLFIGGLARLDYLEGPPLAYFTLFATNELYIHRTSTEKADDLYSTQLGTLLTPPFKTETLESWPGLGTQGTVHVIDNDDGNWQKACVDLVFSGLGWISVTMKGVAKVRTWYPPGCAVGQRPPLMPFESHLGTLPNPRFNMKPSSVASPPRYDPL